MASNAATVTTNPAAALVQALRWAVTRAHAMLALELDPHADDYKQASIQWNSGGSEHDWLLVPPRYAGLTQPMRAMQGQGRGSQPAHQ